MGAYPQQQQPQPLFTAAQWAELEQQALIYKYLTAGVPVPPDLLIPMRPHSAAFSFSPAAGAASSLYHHHHPSLSYYAYYGKKLDPEPWRCRRTDGKKWRCSKEAHPDSKYCERHMHRGRNRSRKPVESSSKTSASSPPAHQPQLSSTTATSAATRRETEPRTHGPLSLGGGAAAGSSLQLHHHHLDASSFSLGANKAEVGELSFMSGASAGNGSRAGFTIDSSPSDGSSWQTSMASASGGHGSFTLSSTTPQQELLSGGYNYSNLETPRQVTIASLSREQQQQRRSSSFNGGTGGLQEEENQAVRPFLDEWPAARDSWSEMDDARTSSFSTTQLSISIPRCD